MAPLLISMVGKLLTDRVSKQHASPAARFTPVLHPKRARAALARSRTRPQFMSPGRNVGTHPYVSSGPIHLGSESAIGCRT